MQAIFTKLLYTMQEHRSAMLLTVIAENGSAPRGPGAQMLVTRHGIAAGSIGGGAVEFHAATLAQELLSAGKNDLRTFALHPAGSGDIGMVCGGDVTVHFQYIAHDDPMWQTVCKAVLDRISSHQGGWLRLPLHEGCPRLIADDCAEIPQAISLKKQDITICDKEYYLPLPIDHRALLFGAGHCALALAPLLKSVGFRVVVFDDRPELLTCERFPAADALICGDFRNIAQYLTIRENDFTVVMTSGHSHDFEVEQQLLRRPPAYVGVIGSRSKTASVNQRLRRVGITEEAIAMVHTPVGTPIKAVTPQEIAVSIAGEMIYERACLREGK